MKKFVATFLVLGTGLMVSACASNDQGYRDLQPPYADERTAGGEKEMPVRRAPARAERVFREVQTK